jgi:RNA polymerase sigma-70 factor (ECF subfamily)
VSATNPDPLTDEQLLTRLRAGDTELFGELVRRYERELYGYLRRYVGDDELAADVFQNTFLAVFTKLAQYEPGRPVRPWLYTVATHQAIDALRRRQRRKDTRAADGGESPGRPLLDLLASADVAPDERAEAEETRRAVRAAVDALPDLLRGVVVLCYFQGLSNQDAADILGVPVGTVKSRLHTAVAKLAEAWAGPKPEPPNRDADRPRTRHGVR